MSGDGTDARHAGTVSSIADCPLGRDLREGAQVRRIQARGTFTNHCVCLHAQPRRLTIVPVKGAVVRDSRCPPTASIGGKRTRRRSRPSRETRQRARYWVTRRRGAAAAHVWAFVAGLRKEPKKALGRAGSEFGFTRSAREAHSIRTVLMMASSVRWNLGSSWRRASIFLTAWRTVVWSLPPKPRPMSA